MPETKIRERFERNQPLIRKAVLMAEFAVVYDASALNAAPRRLLKIANGIVEYAADERPAWFDAHYGDILPPPLK